MRVRTSHWEGARGSFSGLQVTVGGNWLGVEASDSLPEPCLGLRWSWKTAIQGRGDWSSVCSGLSDECKVDPVVS